MSVLQAILDCMEVFQKTYSEDTFIAVLDTEKIIGYLPGKTMDFGFKVGDLVSNFEKTITVQAMRQGKVLQEERDSSQFGIAYISTAVPIYENGKIVGAIGAVTSNKRMDTLRNSALELSAIVEEVSATTEQVTLASNEITVTIQELANDTEEMRKDAKGIESVLKFIHEVATQSNLLGLNAAIEAARAGEHGRGFAVVAEEVRKLSDNSKQAVVNIQEQLQTITKGIEHANALMQQIAANTEEHSASIEEINATFAQIANLAEKLAVEAEIK